MRVEIVLQKERQVPVREILTSVWQQRWKEWCEEARVDTPIIVPAFPDKPREEGSRTGDKPIYVPPELSTTESLPLLGKIFGIGNYSVKEGHLPQNIVDHSGWRYIEASQNPSYAGLNEEALRTALSNLGREGVTLNEEIIASHFTKLLTGRFLDEGIWVMVLGTRKAGRALNLSFYPDGEFMCTYDWGGEKRLLRGARSSTSC